MNRPSTFPVTRYPLSGDNTAPASPSPIGVGATSQATIADASKVTSRGFLDAITGRSDEVRAAERQQIIDRCIRAIRNGDTYGFGPALVAECKQIMAEEDASLVYVERIAPGRVAL